MLGMTSKNLALLTSRGHVQPRRRPGDRYAGRCVLHHINYQAQDYRAESFHINSNPGCYRDLPPLHRRRCAPLKLAPAPVKLLLPPPALHRNFRDAAADGTKWCGPGDNLSFMYRRPGHSIHRFDPLYRDPEYRPFLYPYRHDNRYQPALVKRATPGD